MTRIRLPRPVAVLGTGALVLALTACFGSPEPTVVDRYYSAVSVPADAAADVRLVADTFDSGSDDGPTLDIPDNATVVNGGSIQQTLSSDQPFTAVLVAVEDLVPTGPTATPGEGEVVLDEPTGTPDNGYYEVTLSEPVTEATIVLTTPQALPATQFMTFFALVGADGTQGPPHAQTVDAVTVGTGDVQVSISWDVDSDLDLHVVSPDGEEIYWDAPTSSTGGALDLDSNAGCEIDGVRNENITWATGDAPAGEYKVLVDLWDACGTTATSYVVTVTVVGGATQTYSGEIDGPGSNGGAGAGELVATFEVPETE